MIVDAPHKPPNCTALVRKFIPEYDLELGRQLCKGMVDINCHVMGIDGSDDALGRQMCAASQLGRVPR